jgi:hypothetical protein
MFVSLDDPHKLFMANFKQCKAKSKRTGERCKARAVRGMDVCYHHGGATPKGLASPNLKTGRYSKHLPQRLTERYEAALEDAELITLRDDIALLDVRIGDVLARIPEGEFGELWVSMQRAFHALDRAIKNQDALDMIAALGTLGSLIQQGSEDYLGWRDLRAMLQERRALVESEQKRLIAAEQMITTEQAMLLITTIGSILKARIHDRQLLSEISQDLSALLNRGSSNTVIG